MKNSPLHNGIRLACVAALFGAAAAQAADFFVSPNGLNSNSGTSAGSPVQTLAKAFSLISPGDTLHLMEGTYTEEIDLSNFSGSTAPVTTIKAYQDDHVVWYGFASLDEVKANGADWVQHSGSIYKIQLDTPVWQLFVDGAQMVPSRWPNARWDDGTWWSRDGSMAHGGSSDTNGSQYDTPQNGNSLAADIDFSLQGGIGILNTGSWKTYAAPITSHTPNSDHFTYPSINNTYKANGLKHRFWVEGKLELLDSELEWFLDTATNILYLWGPGGTKPSGNIYGKVKEFALTLDQSRNIRIEGIRFEGISIKGHNSDKLHVEDCDFWYPTFNRRMLGDTGAIPIMTFTGTEDAKFINCRWEHVEGSAIDLNGNRNLIENCLFYDIDWSCANIPGLGLTLNLNGDDGIIRYVTIKKTSASSTIKLGGAYLAEFIDISETGWLQNDGSTIQVTKLDQKDALIRYNWDHDTIKKGIRFDTTNDGTFGYDGNVHHNVTFNVGGQGIHLKGDRHMMVNNTSFDNDRNDMVMNFDFSDENINSTTKNNAANQISGDRNNDKVLPGFVEANWDGTDEGADVKSLLRDVANFDFRPKAGSALVDAGVVVAGISAPYVGSAPDIGAYEYGDSFYWIPGYREHFASFPIPANGADSVYTGTGIIWKHAYKAVAHRLFFGTAPDSLAMIDTYTTGNVYEPGGLDPNITYYWRVDAVHADGEVVTGEVWSFNTNNGGGDEAYFDWRNSNFTAGEVSAGTGNKNVDADGDGQDNYSEFLAGTSPKDPNSFFTATASYSGSSLDVQFDPVDANRLYRVSKSVDLQTWSVEEIPQSEFSDGLLQLSVEPRIFYQVEAIR